MELTADEIASLTAGAVVAGDGVARASSYAIDSRALTPGACFVALVADRDGHDFVGDAFAHGATVALVAHTLPGVTLPRGGALVQVANPLGALGALGGAARARFTGTLVVGITGSAGKTGTKDLTQAALGGPPEVHASPGSYNNEAGVPLTLLAAPPDARAIVLEMGARARGDIAALCGIARPDAGVITNVGLAHAGPLGGPEGITLAKGELFEALPASGLGVLDADDSASDAIARRTAARVLHVSAGGSPGADVRASGVAFDALLRPRFTIETPWGSAPVRLGLHGDHVVVNALLAATVALDAGLDLAGVASRLASVVPAPWRMEIVRAPSGLVVVNDAYNANPSSTAAGLRALAQFDTSGRRIAVLGEMRELGAYSVEEHARIGHLAADLGIDVVVAVGPETAPLAEAAGAGPAPITVLVVPDARAALDAVRATVDAGDAVLVKGSRAVGLEVVARALVEGGAPASSVGCAAGGEAAQ